MISFTGDGSIGFVLGDMETIKRSGKNVTIILTRNDSFGWIRGEAILLDEVDEPWSTEFDTVDYLKIAEGFGLTLIRSHQKARSSKFCPRPSPTPVQVSSKSEFQVRIKSSRSFQTGSVPQERKTFRISIVFALIVELVFRLVAQVSNGGQSRERSTQISRAPANRRYARSLLAATPASQLKDPEKPKAVKGISRQQLEMIWGQERETLRAFVSLLGIRRLTGPAEDALPKLFERSLTHQGDVTEVLSDQFELVSARTVRLSLCRAESAPLGKSGGAVEFEIRSS